MQKHHWWYVIALATRSSIGPLPSSSFTYSVYVSCLIWWTPRSFFPSLLFEVSRHVSSDLNPKYPTDTWVWTSKNLMAQKRRAAETRDLSRKWVTRVGARDSFSERDRGEPQIRFRRGSREPRTLGNGLKWAPEPASGHARFQGKSIRCAPPTFPRKWVSRLLSMPIRLGQYNDFLWGERHKWGKEGNLGFSVFPVSWQDNSIIGAWRQEPSVSNPFYCQRSLSVILGTAPISCVRLGVELDLEDFTHDFMKVFRWGQIMLAKMYAGLAGACQEFPISPLSRGEVRVRRELCIKCPPLSESGSNPRGRIKWPLISKRES